MVVSINEDSKLFNRDYSVSVWTSSTAPASFLSQVPRCHRYLEFGGVWSWVSEETGLKFGGGKAGAETLMQLVDLVKVPSIANTKLPISGCFYWDTISGRVIYQSDTSLPRLLSSAFITSNLTLCTGGTLSLHKAFGSSFGWGCICLNIVRGSSSKGRTPLSVLLFYGTIGISFTFCQQIALKFFQKISFHWMISGCVGLFRFLLSVCWRLHSTILCS